MNSNSIHTNKALKEDIKHLVCYMISFNQSVLVNNHLLLIVAVFIRR